MLWIAKINKKSWRIPCQPGIGKEGKNRKGRDEREDEKKTCSLSDPSIPSSSGLPRCSPVVATCLAQKAIFLLLFFLHDFPYFPNRRRIKLKMPPRLSSLFPSSHPRKIQIKWGRTCCVYCGNRKIPFLGHQLEIERTPETSALLIQTETTVFHDVQEKDILKEIPGWQHLQNQGILFYSQAEAV